MRNIVWVSPQGHRSVSVSRHFLLQAPQYPCSVRKRFSRDHCCRGRTKSGCWIAGLWGRTLGQNWPPEPTSSMPPSTFDVNWSLTKDHNRFATRVLPIVWSQPTNALLGVCSHYCCYIKMWNCNGTRKSRDNSLHRCRVYLRVVGARQTVAKFNSKFPLTSQPSFDCIAFKCNQHFYCKQETQLSQTRCAQHHIKHLQRTCTILMKCWF